MDRQEDAPHRSRASDALSERFKPKRSGAQKACHERTKIQQHRLSRLASGDALPTPKETALLEESEGIPMAWWAQPPLPAEDEEAPPDSSLRGPGDAANGGGQ